MARDHHRWLHEQLAAWRAEGVVDAGTAERIAARHPVGAPGIPMLLFLGAGLVGIGVIWLVAANLEIDEIGPLERSLGAAALWLGLVAAGELLAARERWAPVAGPVRLLAALAYGGTIFQAAQSLQVPAYAPELVLAWGAGALAYAYAVHARGPLIVGVATLTGWYAWALGESGAEGVAIALGLALACPIAAALAAVQDDDFAGPWRFAAAALGLGALAVVSIPEAAGGDAPSTLTIGLGAGAALVAVVAAAVRAPDARREVSGAAGVAVTTALLLAIAPASAVDFGSDGQVTGGQTAYTLAACGLFLAAAVGVALLGAHQDQRSLTDLAYATLLLFVAVQSFGLLATLTSGAFLVLCVGLILLVAGIVLDRGRRRLKAAA